MKKIGLSVIIPMYNAETWIVPTVDHIFEALSNSDFISEIIIIDDGSKDGSVRDVKSINTPRGIELKLIEQKNTGRYLARKAGVEAAKYDHVLFIDSRVFVESNSLHFLSDQLREDHDQIWNGHVNIDKTGNLFARFWDAIVCIGWRRYFKNPQTTSYTLKDFDYYPKGTGFFFTPKNRLKDAMHYFESHTNDLKFSSDDTLLIRYMIERTPIHISPQLACLYHGRSTFYGFLKHAYNRGQFFVDGFLRPGTRFYYPLLLVLALSLCTVLSFFAWPSPTLVLVGILAVVLALGLFFGALVLGIVFLDAAALGILGVPFAIVYLAGLWRGVVRSTKKIYR